MRRPVFGTAMLAAALMASAQPSTQPRARQQLRVERVNGHMVLSVTDLQHLNALVDQLRSRGGVLSELTPVRSTLEDVFVDLIRTDAHTSVGAHE